MIAMYHYKESGLRNIYLANGFAVRKTPYGESVSITDVEGLHRAIAKCLITSKPHLSGSEFRLIRKELDLSQAKLGELFDYDAQTVALWEKRNRVPKLADRFIRVLYQEYLKENVEIRKLIDRLNEIDREETAKKWTFEDTRKGWRPKAA